MILVGIARPLSSSRLLIFAFRGFPHFWLLADSVTGYVIRMRVLRFTFKSAPVLIRSASLYRVLSPTEPAFALNNPCFQHTSCLIVFFNEAEQTLLRSFESAPYLHVMFA